MADPQLPDPLELPPEKPDESPRQRPAGRAAQWQADGSRVKASGKNTALIVTALLFMAVAGGLVALLLKPTPPVEPYIISVPVIEYRDTSLPPNPWAERDADLLCGVYPADSDNTKRNAQEGAKFRQKLDEIGKLADRWKSFRKDEFDPDRPFVLHVCAHAATARGTLYLLPSDAKAGDPNTWVKVENVLRAMEACPAANKLLVLDIARPTVNPFTGPLLDDTAARLHDLLAKYKTKDGADRLPCPVLTACSPGETSLAVPDARVSAFAFYLAEGLRGAADGYKPGPGGQREKDERVTLQEVAAFVSARVQRWALQNVGVTQTPVLHARGLGDADFPLKLKPDPADDPAPGKLEYAGFEAAARWKDRDALSPAAVRLAGADLARWEAALVRAEQVFAATGSAADANLVLTPAAPFWQRVQQSAPAAAAPRPRYHSWAVAAGEFDKSPPADPVKALVAARDDYLSALAAPPTGTPDPKLGEKRAKFDQAAAAVAPDLAGYAVWRWALDATRPGRRDVPQRVYQAAAEAAAGAARDPSAFYTEALLLQAVALREQNSRYFRNNPGAGPAKAQLLRTEAAAAAAFLQAPDGFGWARDLVEAADKDRRADEAKLFEGEDRSDAEYDAVVQRLAGAEARFKEARDRMAAAARARDVAADALRVLAATAYAAAEYDDVSGGWGELADATQALADAVWQAPKPAGELPTADLTARADRVAARLAEFQARWAPEAVKRRAEPGPTSPAGLRPLAADLTVTLLKADDRKRVWDALRQAAGKFHEKTRKEQDQPENESAATRTKPAGTPIPEPQNPDRRARVAAKLLALAGYAGAGELNRKVEAARSTRTDEAWDGVAAELRAAWGKKLADEIAGYADRKAWERADRAARAFPPGVVPDGARAGAAKAAAAELRRAEADAFREWLRGHYGAYGAIRTAAPGAADSYRKAADETGPRPAD